MDNIDKKLDQDINEVTFVIIDTETTGLKARFRDRIIEIGAIKMLNGQVIDQISSLINPLRPLALGAYNVNKIEHTTLESAPVFEKFSSQFLNFIKDSVIVAYNAPFDIAFLEKELYLLNINVNFHLSTPPTKTRINYLEFQDSPISQKHNLNSTYNHYYVVDVLILIRNIFPNLPMYKQSFVSNYLGITNKPTHRALNDAYTTMQIFNITTEILKNFGFKKLKELIYPDNLYNKISFERTEKLNSAILNKKRISIEYISTDGIRHYNVLPLNFDTDKIMLEAIIDNNSKYFFLDKILKVDETI